MTTILKPAIKKYLLSARHDLINPPLEKSGWKVQHFKTEQLRKSILKNAFEGKLVKEVVA
ncbi:hypothetical protein HY636_02835 [Candidatus Woesearchaeota archaeon]|nr:hypothetical protein [Candidatus Woesearchaeota archaeon]